MYLKALIETAISAQVLSVSVSSALDDGCLPWDIPQKQSTEMQIIGQCVF